MWLKIKDLEKKMFLVTVTKLMLGVTGSC